MSDKVLLGFEVPSGQDVYIPTDLNIAATGQTRRSGKTSAIEGVLERGSFTALTFRTKKNEQGFYSGRIIEPYYKASTDWVYIKSLAEAALNKELSGMYDRWFMEVCLPPDQEIITANGLKKIGEIVEGDLVLTHRGRYRRVLRKFTRKYEGELLTFKTRSALVTSFTPNHPILTMELGYHEGKLGLLQKQLAWTRADQIILSNSHNKSRHQFAVMPRTLEVNDVASYKAIQKTRRHSKISLILPVNEPLMCVIGYYLAEGFPARTNKGKNCYYRTDFAFGKNLFEFEHATELMRALAELKVKSHIQFVQRGIKVVADSAILANFLSDEFGHGAANKKIPFWVKLLSAPKLKLLLEAYWKGDGGILKKGFRASTVSKGLAFGIREVALKLGYNSTVGECKPDENKTIVGKLVKLREKYWISWSSPIHGSARNDHEYIYPILREKVCTQYTGTVCNLEVEEDNSFCTLVGAVHNCGETGHVGRPKDLGDVRKNIDLLLEGDGKKGGLRKATGFAESMLYSIRGYLDLVLPNLKSRKWATSLDIQKGKVNIMDLAGISEAVQSLVIASCIQEVSDHFEDVKIVVPEAPDFFPAAKGSPAKTIARRIAKKGGAVNLNIWLDAQMIADVDPVIRSQARLWLLGPQEYEHEVARTIKLISLPREKRPKTEEVQTLPRGHFYLVFSEEKIVKKVYALPVWLPEEVGRQVARGEVSPISEYVKKFREDYIKSFDDRQRHSFPTRAPEEDWNDILLRVEGIEGKLASGTHA